MFGIEILGGLGNMLFCVATGEWLEHEYKMQVVYPNAVKWFNALPTASTWTTHAEEYKKIFKNFNWFKNQDQVNRITDYVFMPFRHIPIHPAHGICYRGYFQSYKNFNADFIRKRFEPADHIIERLSYYDPLFMWRTCSIHVRRGNYLKLQDKHVVQDMEYFNEAMKRIDTDLFIVFSNDIEWCRKNFIGEKFIFVEDTDYIEMFLMSRCTHNIISNSSFSYWGAMLGDTENRKVIYPANWFAYNSEYASDICPPFWEKL